MPEISSLERRGLTWKSDYQSLRIQRISGSVICAASLPRLFVVCSAVTRSCKWIGGARITRRIRTGEERPGVQNVLRRFLPLHLGQGFEQKRFDVRKVATWRQY